MKKMAIFLSALAISVGGCATIDSATAPARKNMLKLALGMDKPEALRVMGKRTVSVKTDLFHSIIINSPYRSEILQGNEKTFEVIYYVTEDKYDDEAIYDDDLTPLVFENSKLIGWGRNFLQEIISRNAIETAGRSKKSKSDGK